jgi:hypothetical protein
MPRLARPAKVLTSCHGDAQRANDTQRATSERNALLTDGQTANRDIPAAAIRVP